MRSETLSPTSNQPSSPDQPQDDDDFGLMDFLGCKVIKYIFLDREIIKLILMVTMMVMLVLTKLMF